VAGNLILPKHLPKEPSAPHEGFIPVENGALYFREIGRGQPVVILHGGPDFNHHYLLPEMDDLAASLRLIYYDQRGRGKSGGEVQPEEVSMDSEIEDLESLRAYFQLDSVAVLGHSWGGLLAMEYAIRHPDRASHLILMNSAPASHDDFTLLRQDRLRRAAGDIEQLKTMRSTPRYQQGDLEADAEYYRIHFRAALRRTELLENVVQRLRANFTKEGIRKAREIEDRLVQETWLLDEYDLFPGLARLRIPTLVLHGEYDLIPGELAARIAQAIPGARFALIRDVGHFSFIESPEEVRREIIDFIQPANAQVIRRD
jgi:proline iminopeptidase